MIWLLPGNGRTIWARTENWYCLVGLTACLPLERTLDGAFGFCLLAWCTYIFILALYLALL